MIRKASGTEFIKIQIQIQHSIRLTNLWYNLRCLLRCTSSVKHLHNACIFPPDGNRSVYNIHYASLILYFSSIPVYGYKYFYVVQYLQKNFKIKRNPMVTGDNIIIRVNLIRHIIFRNPQVCLIKYLYHSQLGTKKRGKCKWIPQQQLFNVEISTINLYPFLSQRSAKTIMYFISYMQVCYPSLQAKCWL